MGADVRSAVLEMFREVRITSPDAVRIGENEYRGLKDYLVPWLQCEIYKNFFCSMRQASVPVSIPLLVRALSSANAALGTAQPGSYLAYGPSASTGTKWLRLYWNVNAGGALVLTRIATEILNRLPVPFRLKVLLDASIARRDAAVLYLPLGQWLIARDIVGPVLRQLEDTGGLEATTPLFTKMLRPGVGLAEDPQMGLSFGMHRSGLLARSLARSYLAGHREEEQQWSGLTAEFAREGLSIERAYLNAGSRDVYEF
jgi:hypothetical protein